jgi:hypothetical protein
MMRHFATGFAIALAVFTLVTMIRPALFQTPGANPHPDLLPRQVVEIQLDALRRSDPSEDGIAVAYRFASAMNQMHTGPLSRFGAMLKSDDYATLLNQIGVEFGPTVDLDSRSYVPVVVTNDAGVSTAFIWVLSRSKTNPCGDCWMTDAVIPAGSLDRIRFA